MRTMSIAIDIDHLRGWVGRTEDAEDVVTPRLAQGLRATLFQTPDVEPGQPAPLATHWCLAPTIAAMDELGEDGHPRRGGFMPPVPLPSRMWAGGRLRILDRLRVGDRVRLLSRIADVALKQGSSGMLCFVTVEHSWLTDRGPAIEERRDMVYRDAVKSTPARAAEPEARAAAHSVSHMADPVLLFRYSALSFNGHRIHYDRDYATGVEGYKGLVVHGPLQASLMLEMAAGLRGGTAPAEFRYRGIRPLFDGAAFSVNADGSGEEFWVADGDGHATMTATARW